MGRNTTKKHVDKHRDSERKKTLSSKKDSFPKGKRVQPRKTKLEKGLCCNCSKDLRGENRSLFVEEDVSRIFCSENCITQYFSPDIEKFEKEYFERLSPNDLTQDEKQKLSKLRWATLQGPHEVWREKSLKGDNRFTLISEFQADHLQIWYICICLFLRGEPSFLFLAFPTRDAAMVDHYRKGELMPVIKSTGIGNQTSELTSAENTSTQLIPMDGLAEDWTEEETMRAELIKERRPDDIPATEFILYQSCLEETLEIPDEVWSIKTEDNLKLYHFIKYYPNENPGMWYLIIAREVEDVEQIEILDAFPTRDQDLVDRHRQGEQEVGEPTAKTAGRVVH